eukprot:306366_1
MLALAYAVVTLTVLSLSAICSNGRMKGGGCYFLISRALGPEFGGAIGLIFFIANVFGVCVYLVGFSEALFSYLTTISATPVSLALSKSIPLVVLAVVCLVGAQAFAKTSLGIFVLMIISIFSCLLSTISQKSGQIDGYTGWSLETLNENVWSHFDEVDEHGKTYNFFTIFAIFFPAVTGIMAGANMSGDLTNPAKDIPGGTLRSLVFTGITYTAFIATFAFTILPYRLNCVSDDCLDKNGTPSGYLVLQHLSWIPIFSPSVFGQLLFLQQWRP